ncbi:hypothetical protein F5I97DRAFT_456868 [Phlebopus sp. FC_14]|nr:hypothetical protein F5I97DRAFT_456868 [Phlebopus sp. FC_14]
MAAYSALFSSGLLAPHACRFTTPAPPSSPIPMASSPADPVDRQMSVTPTPTNQGPNAKNPQNLDRPRMRRRRSSMNIGASPMSFIKSPTRNAGTALQRTGIMSPTRSRAGSVAANEASESNSLFGRLRSGSVGGVPPQTRTRRAVRRTVPHAPPPTMPLPALPPPSPSTKCADALTPPTLLVSVPRQPLSTRPLPAENVSMASLLSPTLLPSPTLLSPDYAPKVPFKMAPSRASSPAIPERAGYFDNIVDEEMIEN